jgi:hypothetical protein
MEKKLTKLDALRILSNAYWYVADIHNYRDGILYDRFNYLRRSINMEDLKPVPKCAEGFNPKGPRYL